LEYLETLGVPVISYSKSQEFPAFFTRRSGINVPWNMDNPVEVARTLVIQEQLRLNGVLIAVPIPQEHEGDGILIQEAIDQAISESEANGMSKQSGNTTPWLLRRIEELTQGRSLSANIALLRNTALIGECP
jgi:pseudouridylate synthase / pseudouridine kinase